MNLWKCEHCGEERPDRYVTVTKAEAKLNGATITRNVRHCADCEKCIQGAVLICDQWKKFVDKVHGPRCS